jgi:predicted PurR-regulated permease PerM
MGPDPVTVLLTPGQRRLVGFAAAFAALLVVVAGVIAALIALGRLVAFFSGVLWPLAVAGVLAMVLRPVVSLLEQRLRLRRLSAVILLYALFLLAAMAVLTQLVPPLVGQLIDLLDYVTRVTADPVGYLAQHHPAWTDFVRRQMANPVIQHLTDQLTRDAQALGSAVLPSLRAAGGGVLGAVTALTHTAMVPVYLFFFLLSRGWELGRLGAHLPFLGPDLRDDVLFLLREFITIVESFFRGPLLIGLLMGVLLALGFSIVGLNFGLFIGLALGVLNIVPYLGTILGLAAALPLAFLQDGGGWKLVGLVLLVKVIVQAIEGWILTPKIMGDRTGLHPVAIMVAIFFWGTAFGGVLGMLLAIPLTAFFVTAWRLARKKYFHDAPPAPRAP